MIASLLGYFALQHLPLLWSMAKLYADNIIAYLVGKI
jgi:hypothetical protein